ncbi:MAG: class I SAM-dependent methyltransferase [Cyanobacteria bacterium]|nr:class I SAM-dependent methyltransferase [Cyanobacteriota bacterium]
MVKPTLHCPCEGRYLERTFEYDAPPAGETAFDLGGQVYSRAYDRCGLCDHWFGHHTLDLSGLYTKDYVDATYGGMKGMAERLDKILALPPERSDNAGRVSYIQTFVENHLPGSCDQRRLLDVGAGIGVFPAAMKALGWQVMGVEPDPRTAKHLQEHVGIQALSVDLLTLFPEQIGLFDVITFNKVLEHVEDPVTLLSHARCLLKPQGYCYVELPDVSAATEGPRREEFFIEHHHVFSATSMTLLAERAGLSIRLLERLREPSGKFTLRAFAKVCCRKQ